MSLYGLWSIVSFHMVIVVGNIISAFILPFCTPWYIALPIIALIVNLTFSSTLCPLTKLENRIRRSLGMKEIRHFVGHYVIWPVKKRLRYNAKTVRVAAKDLMDLGVITDGRGRVWSNQCPLCTRQDTMEVIQPGEIQCAVCAYPQELS